jgi:hypothetical protein
MRFTVKEVPGKVKVPPSWPCVSIMMSPEDLLEVRCGGGAEDSSGKLDEAL